eukprot:COSAG03_NODE_179_length_11021_cov_4.016206_1_plen_114_part_00
MFSWSGKSWYSTRQNLSEAGQIEFAKNWGALEVFPFAVADDDLAVDPQIHRFHVGTQGAGAAPPEAMLPPEQLRTSTTMPHCARCLKSAWRQAGTLTSHGAKPHRWAQCSIAT